jgi:hypothetical protein
VTPYLERYLEERRTPPGTTPLPDTATVKAEIVKLFAEVIKPAQCMMTPVPKQQIRELFGLLVRKLEQTYNGFHQTVTAPPNHFENKDAAAETAIEEIESICRDLSGKVAMLFVGEDQFSGNGVLPREMLTQSMVRAVLEVVELFPSTGGTIPMFDENGKPRMAEFELALWCDELLVLTTLHELRAKHGLQVEITKSVPLDLEGSLPIALEVDCRGMKK